MKLTDRKWPLNFSISKNGSDSWYRSTRKVVWQPWSNGLRIIEITWIYFRMERFRGRYRQVFICDIHFYCMITWYMVWPISYGYHIWYWHYYGPILYATDDMKRKLYNINTWWAKNILPRLLGNPPFQSSVRLPVPGCKISNDDDQVYYCLNELGFPMQYRILVGRDTQTEFSEGNVRTDFILKRWFERPVEKSDRRGKITKSWDIFKTRFIKTRTRFKWFRRIWNRNCY